MVDLMPKKIGKLISLKKSDFNDFIKAKEISLTKPRLIPIFKLGDEMALTSVLLSTIRLVKEFREEIFSEAKLQKGGSLYVYTEVAFKDFPNSRIDGLILVVKSGTIRDAAILEMKNGRNNLDKEQIEKYQQIAKKYGIPKFITVSNQFVSDSSQSPVETRKILGLEMYHFSWTYLLTIAHILLFKNDTNIEDEDQVEIMREVVRYFENDKSGVVGVNQMSQGWVSVVEKINSGSKIKVSDADVFDTVLSWQQEEHDMTLSLSRMLGIHVNSGEIKFKGKLEERLKADSRSFVESKQLSSVLRVKGAVSDIRINAFFEKRTVEMLVSLKPPSDKTYKGQLGWIKRQFDTCEKRNPELFNALANNVYLEVLIKNSSNTDRFSLSNFESTYESLKGKEIREFKIIYLLDFGKSFSSTKKFVEVIEEMLKNYYIGIVQYLTKWEPSAPKVENEQKILDDEEFIERVNNNEFVVIPELNMVNEIDEKITEVSSVEVEENSSM